jgi:hypothetical protein
LVRSAFSIFIFGTSAELASLVRLRLKSSLIQLHLFCGRCLMPQALQAISALGANTTGSVGSCSLLFLVANHYFPRIATVRHAARPRLISANSRENSRGSGVRITKPIIIAILFLTFLPHELDGKPHSNVVVALFTVRILVSSLALSAGVSPEVPSTLYI